MMIEVRTDASNCSYPLGSWTDKYCYQYENADTGYIYGGEAYAKQGFFNDKFVLGANMM